MPRRHTYRLLIRWTHRTYGPQLEKVSAEGTSIRRAIANALLAFFSSNNKKMRRDAHAQIEVQAWRVKTPPAK